jgi:excisionase family DNA binding protein
MQDTKPNLPAYFTPEEVAASLRVTEPTVYEWLRSRQLEGVKAGKFWRVSQQALEAFLQIERGRGGRPKKPAAPPAGPVRQAEPEKPAAPPSRPPATPPAAPPSRSPAGLSPEVLAGLPRVLPAAPPVAQSARPKDKAGRRR